MERKYSKNDRISVTQEVAWSNKFSWLAMLLDRGSRIRKGRSAICTFSDNMKRRRGTVGMSVHSGWERLMCILLLTLWTRSNICSSRRRDSIFSSTFCFLVIGHFIELYSNWHRMISSNKT